jgi:tetratricopeptide (TPR) repeat protein
LTEVRKLLEEALSIHREVGDLRNEANALGQLAQVLYRAGDVEKARAMFDESVEMLRRVGATVYVIHAVCDMAALERQGGFPERARRLLEEGRALALAGGGAALLARCEEGLETLRPGPD